MNKFSCQALALIGSRTINPEEAFSQTLTWLEENIDLATVTKIYSGGATGADQIGKILAGHLKLELVVFLPNYQRYGRRAPLVRNEQIALADACLAVVDRPLQESRGTADCVRKFSKLEKPVWVLQLDSKSL